MKPEFITSYVFLAVMIFADSCWDYVFPTKYLELLPNFEVSPQSSFNCIKICKARPRTENYTSYGFIRVA